MRTEDEPQRPADSRWPVDRLISISDIRVLFELGRTAAYELTHRPDFPDPVVLSSRCYRWWASEVTAFAIAIRSESKRVSRHRNATRGQVRHAPNPASPSLRISGRVRAARTRRNPS